MFLHPHFVGYVVDLHPFSSALLDLRMFLYLNKNEVKKRRIQSSPKTYILKWHKAVKCNFSSLLSTVVSSWPQLILNNVNNSMKSRDCQWALKKNLRLVCLRASINYQKWVCSYLNTEARNSFHTKCILRAQGPDEQVWLNWMIYESLARGHWTLHRTLVELSTKRRMKSPAQSLRIKIQKVVGEVVVLQHCFLVQKCWRIPTAAARNEKDAVSSSKAETF